MVSKNVALSDAPLRSVAVTVTVWVPTMRLPDDQLITPVVALIVIVTEGRCVNE